MLPLLLALPSCAETMLMAPVDILGTMAPPRRACRSLQPRQNQRTLGPRATYEIEFVMTRHKYLVRVGIKIPQPILAKSLHLLFQSHREVLCVTQLAQHGSDLPFLLGCLLHVIFTFAAAAAVTTDDRSGASLARAFPWRLNSTCQGTVQPNTRCQPFQLLGFLVVTLVVHGRQHLLQEISQRLASSNGQDRLRILGFTIFGHTMHAFPRATLVVSPQWCM
mmetsp:Transcript_40762/g.107985  ORF Transcript_40762/g.107985 Transcript_40762/m.107985 type:complete len:221 (-) Transcript_40762:378-1040(-)